MARGKYPSDKQDQFMVRLPKGMRDRIKVAAEANARSMNAEIVARLDDSLAGTGAKGGGRIMVRLEALPEGAEPAEVSLGTFLQNFDTALRASLATPTLPVAEIERATDGLQPPIEDFEDEQ